ncbi:hypothetical protein ABZY20_00255 [Streptomyces sp. NPDC006624]
MTPVPAPGRRGRTPRRFRLLRVRDEGGPARAVYAAAVRGGP